MEAVMSSEELHHLSIYSLVTKKLIPLYEFLYEFLLGEV